MKEKPAYENDPVSEEEMGKCYKSWMQVLALYVVMAYDPLNVFYRKLLGLKGFYFVSHPLATNLFAYNEGCFCYTQNKMTCQA